MADQENCARLTRAAKKRAASVAALGNAEDQPLTKKRVVLGELPNLSNAVVVPVTKSLKAEPQKPKGKAKAKPKVKRALEPKKKTTTANKKEDVEAKVDDDFASDDPQMCEPYVTDIYDYLCNMEVEPKRRPLPDYIEKVQKDISANMRGILVDWLVEVSEEYKLLSDSLYLTISYIDRFLSLNVINRQKLQLLGVSSMLIASRLSRVAQEDYKTSSLQLEFLGYYLAELSLLDYSCVKFLPSLVAASVIYLARFITRPKVNPWNPTLQQYSGYKASDIKECVLIIHDLYLSRRGGALQAVREKYNQHKFKCVANLPSSPEIPVSYFEDVKELKLD
ncbi:hypothetical protein EZV62_021660 [Acer yangbiense]|uniref:Uncharacterized protein n=1 Tax=Acer yangbiense TaxID=1000413 RepID=A0A5C7H6B5_9ROSI|nr:hypothetical protein EZV62_021660 [Acer yangbiense]